LGAHLGGGTCRRTLRGRFQEDAGWRDSTTRASHEQITKPSAVREPPSSCPMPRGRACTKWCARDLVKVAIEGRLPRAIGVARLCDAPAQWSPVPRTRPSKPSAGLSRIRVRRRRHNGALVSCNPFGEFAGLHIQHLNDVRGTIFRDRSGAFPAIPFEL
jgi:hypothetical protein